MGDHLPSDALIVAILLTRPQALNKHSIGYSSGCVGNIFSFVLIDSPSSTANRQIVAAIHKTRGASDPAVCLSPQNLMITAKLRKPRPMLESADASRINA
jgi:hypothetical protein